MGNCRLTMSDTEYALPIITQAWESGLHLLPPINGTKRPQEDWKQYQHDLQPSCDLSLQSKSVGILCGTHANLEAIDFDSSGWFFPEFMRRLMIVDDALANKIVIEDTPSTGNHILTRCTVPVDGNSILAKVITDSLGDGTHRVIRHGSTIQIVVSQGKWHYANNPNKRYELDKNSRAHLVPIETRGQGGYIVTAPTPGYTARQGTIASLPIISSDERAVLLQIARNMSDPIPQVSRTPLPFPVTYNGPARPGDRYAASGDHAALLNKHGWTFDHAESSNEHWTRPGKDGGTSATWHVEKRVFFVFSTSTHLPAGGMNLFQLRAHLDFDDDFSACTTAIVSEGFGESDEGTISANARRADTLLEAMAEKKPAEPGPSPLGFHILSPEEWRKPLPKREWLIEGMLPKGGVGLICSSPGKGKSLLLVELAEAVALGREFGGFACKPGKVLYCAPDSPLSVQYRLQGISAEAAENVFFAPMVSVPKDFVHIGDSFSLVIVDTYDRAREHTDAGSAGQDRLVQKIVGSARDFAYQTGAVPVFSHHTTRADEGRPRGSQSFDGLCDMIGSISQVTPGTVSLQCLKMRDGNEFAPLTWDIAIRPGLNEETDWVPYLKPSASQTITSNARAIEQQNAEGAVLDALERSAVSSIWTYRSLAESTKVPFGTIQKVVARLRQKNLMSQHDLRCI